MSRHHSGSWFESSWELGKEDFNWKTLLFFFLNSSFWLPWKNQEVLLVKVASGYKCHGPRPGVPHSPPLPVASDIKLLVATHQLPWAELCLVGRTNLLVTT